MSEDRTDTERLDWIESVDAQVEWTQTGWATSMCKVSNLLVAGEWKPYLREAIDAAMEEDERTGVKP